MDRRDFIGGLFALSGLACRGMPSAFKGRKPNLKFGVISDLHVGTPDMTDKFERALAYFRERKADAVVVAGDLSDWGLRSGFKYVKDAWDKVFPGDRGADGRPVQRLFVTGNHDWDGWWYGDITLDMHLNGYSEEDSLYRHGMKECWEEAFGEPYAEFRRRSVNGYDFVSSEYSGAVRSDNDAQMAEWLLAHENELPKDRPFFFFRHEPVGGTVPGASNKPDPLKLRDALARFPNCIVFTGHTHWPATDERAIWQDGFTAISVPSMSYSTMIPDYENGHGNRNGKCKASMSVLPARKNLLAAQGYFVSVYNDDIVVERRDFEDGVELAEPWVFPATVEKGRPYSYAEHAKALPVPQFPADASVKVHTVNSERRDGRWAIFMEFKFPAAMAGKVRVLDYEIRAVGLDGTVHAKKRYLSPAFYLPERYEPETVKFLFDGMDLPESGRYRFEIYPRNSFGKTGNPIRSREFESVPGKAKAKWTELRFPPKK